ncbi:hypothetical protein ACUHMQ_10500 [Chitinimonas sp. PSY-7]|uniref:hypothetical protein n=1 Tax=Chitinimonas sp. PSY-7 TaxID=3459088 RepID=UPI0040401475
MAEGLKMDKITIQWPFPLPTFLKLSLLCNVVLLVCTLSNITFKSHPILEVSLLGGLVLIAFITISRTVKSTEIDIESGEITVRYRSLPGLRSSKTYKRDDFDAIRSYIIEPSEVSRCVTAIELGNSRNFMKFELGNFSVRTKDKLLKKTRVEAEEAIQIRQVLAKKWSLVDQGCTGLKTQIN